jgi:hypothetical protein
VHLSQAGARTGTDDGRAPAALSYPAYP